MFNIAKCKNIEGRFQIFEVTIVAKQSLWKNLVFHLFNLNTTHNNPAFSIMNIIFFQYLTLYIKYHTSNKGKPFLSYYIRKYLQPQTHPLQKWQLYFPNMNYFEIIVMATRNIFLSF